MKTPVSRRKLGQALASDLDLALTLLSFIHKIGQVSVSALLEQGPAPDIFSVVFDLYDVDLVKRSGGNVSVTRQGELVLSRFGLL